MQSSSEDSSLFSMGGKEIREQRVLWRGIPRQSSKICCCCLESECRYGPNLQGNIRAFMLWVDGVLSGECGALAKDVSHYGGMFVSPILLYIRARRGQVEIFS